MSDVAINAELPLPEKIKILVDSMQENGEYTTVRFAAKKLDVKQTDIRDNLPEGSRLLPSKAGTLSESQITFAAPEVVIKNVSETGKAKASKMSDEVKEPIEKSAVETTAIPPAEGQSIDENTGEAVPQAELETCTVCGNKVRRSTMTRRGICPLCFRQLVKNSGQTAKALEALSEEEFAVVVGEELGRRRGMEDYKNSRILSPEEFAERKDGLLPVKDVFAAAKEAGFGPGRVAQAMGGDRFRHEPIGGFGSVWTPFFLGARKAWYFDKDILNHFDDLRKPVKEKVATVKKERTPKDGTRGAAMKPVAATPTEPVAEATA